RERTSRIVEQTTRSAGGLAHGVPRALQARPQEAALLRLAARLGRAVPDHPPRAVNLSRPRAPAAGSAAGTTGASPGPVACPTRDEDPGMALRSKFLAGNARLEQAAAGGPSVKPLPVPEDAEALRRIQRALAALGYPLPGSFPGGPQQPRDGRFGPETRAAVVAFQGDVFPDDSQQWDGRVGRLTLAEMDKRLLAAPAGAPATAGPVTPGIPGVP